MLSVISYVIIIIVTPKCHGSTAIGILSLDWMWLNILSTSSQRQHELGWSLFLRKIELHFVKKTQSRLSFFSWRHFFFELQMFHRLTFDNLFQTSELFSLLMKSSFLLRNWETRVFSQGFMLLETKYAYDRFKNKREKG